MTQYLLGLDTETTKLPIWGQPSESPEQPHIVQLAALLQSPDRSHPYKILNSLIKPDGWTIDETGEAFKIHGITNERANAEGRPINEVLDEFYAMALMAAYTVGFNVAFDKRLVRIAEKRRHGGAVNDESLPIGVALGRANVIELAPLMKAYCQIPPTAKMAAKNMTAFKPPSLVECLAHIKPGYKPEEGFHDAMGDLKSTMEVFWWLFDKGEISL